MSDRRAVSEEVWALIESRPFEEILREIREAIEPWRHDMPILFVGGVETSIAVAILSDAEVVEALRSAVPRVIERLCHETADALDQRSAKLEAQAKRLRQSGVADESARVA